VIARPSPIELVTIIKRDLGQYKLTSMSPDSTIPGSLSSTKGRNLRRANSTLAGYCRLSATPKVEFQKSTVLFTIDCLVLERPAAISVSKVSNWVEVGALKS